MHPGSVAKRVDGYVIVVESYMSRSGTFSPRYWIYGEDRLAAKPIASEECPAGCLDQEAAVALAEELAGTKLDELKRRGVRWSRLPMLSVSPPGWLWRGLGTPLRRLRPGDESPFIGPPV